MSSRAIFQTSVVLSILKGQKFNMDEIKPNPAAERERERFISSHDIGCIFSYSKVI